MAGSISSAVVCCMSLFLVMCPPSISSGAAGGPQEEMHHPDKEEDWGDGLKVLRIYIPEACEHQAKEGDVIHYHYVGRLSKDGSIFGKSFDYNSPYIVALGHGRIIPGMDRGLMGTCLWERRRISFPPHLGYGERGVGNTIPPNSSLVFYIRLIKLERNGHVLGGDEDISSIWNSGLTSYSDQNWYQTVDMMEEALRLYTHYRNKTLACIKKCDRESTISSLSEKTRKVFELYQGSDQLLEHFVLYGVRGKCISECKSQNLSPKLQYPDPVLMKEFNRYLPYSYLHFAYYKLEEFEVAARCCFTFLHRNPDDELASSSVSFYRNKLDLKDDEFIYREPDIITHQESYLKGRQAYNEEKWLEAKDHFENSLERFKEALSDCYFMCEDVINVNLTQPDMNQMKSSLLEEYGFKSDTMEYYKLLGISIQQVLKCRDECYREVSLIDGIDVDNYLNSHFDFLQYTYYKMGKLNKAARAAATFLAVEPSSEVMTSNIRYYSTTYEVSPEHFVPEEVYVYIHENHQANERLLYFSKHDEMKKKEGRKGDAGDHQAHQEL